MFDLLREIEVAWRAALSGVLLGFVAMWGLDWLAFRALSKGQRSRIAELTKELAESKEDFVRLNTRCVALEQEVDKLRSEAQIPPVPVAAFAPKVLEESEEVHRLKSELKMIARDNRSLQKQVEDARDVISAQEDALNFMRSRIGGVIKT